MYDGYFATEQLELTSYIYGGCFATEKKEFLSMMVVVVSSVSFNLFVVSSVFDHFWVLSSLCFTCLNGKLIGRRYACVVHL